MNKLMILALASLLTACSEPAPKTITGFVDGHFSYVNAPQSGWLDTAQVSQGDKVNLAQLLLQLDDNEQQIQLKQAQASLKQAQAKLADLQLGAREVDLAIIRQQIHGQQILVQLYLKEKIRLAKTVQQNLSSKQQYDQAIANYDVAKAKLTQLNAQLAQAKTPARSEQINQAKASVEQFQAQLEQAQWQLSQRTVVAKNQGIVDEVYVRQGEFVKQGTPLLSILLDGSKKVKFYLPQAKLSELKLQQVIKVQSDGQTKPINATVSFMAKSAEFTPPVIYSKDVRDKLVFLVEAKLPENSELALGQPVDVSW